MQNIVSSIGLFCKRDLYFYRSYYPTPPHRAFKAQFGTPSKNLVMQIYCLFLFYCIPLYGVPGPRCVGSQVELGCPNKDQANKQWICTTRFCVWIHWDLRCVCGVCNSKWNWGLRESHRTHLSEPGFRPCMSSFCLIYTISSEPKLISHLHPFEWAGVDIQWTGSTPAGFQAAFRAVGITHVCESCEKMLGIQRVSTPSTEYQPWLTQMGANEKCALVQNWWYKSSKRVYTGSKPRSNEASWAIGQSGIQVCVEVSA